MLIHVGAENERKHYAQQHSNSYAHVDFVPPHRSAADCASNLLASSDGQWRWTQKRTDRSAEEVKVHVLLLFLLLDHLLLLLFRLRRAAAATACCRATRCRGTATAATEILEFLLTRRNDLVHGLALELGDELFSNGTVVLGLNRLQDLLDVAGARAVIAREDSHQVGGAVLHRHGNERRNRSAAGRWCPEDSRVVS